MFFFKSNTCRLPFSQLKRYSDQDRCAKNLTEDFCKGKNGENVAQIKKRCTCIVIIIKTLGDTFTIDCVGLVVSRLYNYYFNECYHRNNYEGEKNMKE